MKLCFYAIACLLLFSSCNNLNRSSAKEVIKKKNSYPFFVSGFIPVTIRVTKGYPENYDFQGMKQNGLITLNLIQSQDMGWGVVEDYNCQLTPEGEKYLIKDDLSRIKETFRKSYVRGDANNGFNIKLYEVDINTITGIQKNDQTNTASITYTENKSNQTPFANYIKPEANFIIDYTQEKSVILQKYDDGWR